MRLQGRETLTDCVHQLSHGRGSAELEAHFVVPNDISGACECEKLDSSCHADKLPFPKPSNLNEVVSCVRR